MERPNLETQLLLDQLRRNRHYQRKAERLVNRARRLAMTSEAVQKQTLALEVATIYLLADRLHRFAREQVQLALHAGGPEQQLTMELTALALGRVDWRTLAETLLRKESIR